MAMLGLWLTALALAAPPVDGNRLAYLDGHDIYYPHTKFPKLITPQWVGEEGVEAVVILAIDDMRETSKYESYLRPILQRLKQIDGRAPVSIMTCNVQPDDPQLQTWLQEGLSLEVHTLDHPCPLLQGGDFAKAKGTYDKCIDLLFSIPNNTPVAYRMPCCDSLNTVSPRFYKEIFNKTTPNGKFLQISSSVFQVYTADDPEIPRELLFDADGKERFRKYFPKGLKRGEQTHDRFVNYVENYPYPYVIDRLCWEFPCMTPSDWEANFLHQPNNPQTVEDLKAALDITVIKQGVLNLVFHPHGWIQAEQVNELIDHAVAKHGKKVKFLTFKEALERLNENLLAGDALRRPDAQNQPYVLLDLNVDEYLDVYAGATRKVWNPKSKSWTDTAKQFAQATRRNEPSHGPYFGVVLPTQTPSILAMNRMLHWNGHEFESGPQDESLKSPAPPRYRDGQRWGWWCREFRDFDGDGCCELILGTPTKTARIGEPPTFIYRLLRWNSDSNFWIPIGLRLPIPVAQIDPAKFSESVRFVDINEDGQLDIVFSNDERYGVWLFESLDKGWSIALLSGQRDDKPANEELPPIIRADGTDNGFFVRDRALHWQNEDTAHLPNLIVSWDFDKLLGDRMPTAKTPRAAIESMRPRPGYTVELMAHEPLVMDPVAFQWGPDGKLWVVEMADYPNGMDGRGQPGGRVRYLEDTDNDGEYDKSTLFLDGVSFPSGVHPWKSGVLVSAAPDIFFAADTDGDGKADVREVLYTGFTEGNQQHRVNGFTWGLDGWLYLGNGDSGGSITSTKTGKTLDIRGRDLRIHPETGGMEAVNGQTQFGRARDDFGHWFGNNNSRPLWQYVLEDRYLSRNPHLAPPDTRRDVSVNPGPALVYPASKTLTRFNDFDRANRFTSACSAMVYRDELFSGELRVESEELREGEKPNPSDSQLSTLNPQLSFVSEPVHNLVHREILSFDGVRYTSRRADDEQESEFLASIDNWFRPTQLRTGPDGALWIADMYRLVIEHPQWIPQEWQERLNVRDGDDKGRLWRIFPTGAKLRPIPRLDKLTADELVAALDSPSGWQRDMAQQLLIERLEPLDWSKVVKTRCAKLLAELIQSSSRPEVRVQAMYTLHAVGSGISGHGPSMLRDPHPGVRMHAIRLAEPVIKMVALDSNQQPPTYSAICDLVDDPHPWVQLQLAATLGELPGEGPARALQQILMTTDDPHIRAMGLSSVNEHNLPLIVFGLLNVPSEEIIEHGHPLVEPLLTCAVRYNHLPSLKMFAATIVSEDAAQAKPWHWSAIETWLNVQRRSGFPFQDWLESTKPLEPEIAELWQAWLKSLPPLIDDANISPEQRAAALRMFGSTTPNVAFQSDWLKPTQPLELQRAAVELAGQLGSSAPAKEIVMHWRNLSPGLRATARQHLLGRAAIAEALLREVELTNLAPSDVDPETRQLLLAHRETDVRKWAGDIFLTTGENERSQLVAQYLRTMPETGDAAAGRELFSKRCAQCHKLGDLGHAVGPDLVSLTDKSVAAIVAAVLDPNRAVEAKFLQFGALTTTGQTHAGILTNETGTSVTLLAAEAKAATLLRNDLEDLWSINKSLMPEGLEKELTPTALADLAAFIRGNVPLPTRKTFPGNQPQRVAANADGVFVLTPATSEIYGPTIVLEEKYGNLGWWSSADDFVTWTLDVPTSGRYRIDIDYACEAHAAGHRLVASTRGGSVTYKVDATDGWDDYRTTSIGEIDLPSGVQILTLKPASRPLPALLDLKEVRLVPLR